MPVNEPDEQAVEPEGVEPDADEVVMAAVWQYVSVYWEQLHRMCLSAARGDQDIAEELMSDEVYRMLPNLVERWDRKRSFPAYVNSYFYKHLRKCTARRYNKRMVSLDTAGGENDSFKDQSVLIQAGSVGVKNCDDKIEVQDLLECLTEQERMILVLCKSHDYSYREIAAKLGVSYGYIAKVVTFAIKKVRRRAESAASEDK